MRKQIFWIDELLIRAAGVMAVLVAGAAVVGYVGALDAASLPAPLDQWPTTAALLFGLSPVALLVAGITVRRRERRILGIWKILRSSLQISAGELIANSDFNRAELERTVRLLNTKGLGYYVWDRATDLIQDGRLPEGTVDVDHCPSCGASFGAALTASLKESLNCPYCSSTLPSAYHEELQQKTLAKIQRDAGIERAPLEAPAPAPRPAPQPVYAPRPVRRHPKRRFSLSVFIILLIIGWPLALGYAIWKSNSTQYRLDEVARRERW